MNEKIRLAISILQELEPDQGYYLAFSGGKDSCVCKKLLELSGVKFDAHYSNTTIDPPDLVYFIRQYHPDVTFENPGTPFLKRLLYKGFPLRQSRWCCAEYKETGGEDRFVVTGIRREESTKRSKRKLVELCYKNSGKKYLNIIIDWSWEDVWGFISFYGVPYCKLYDQGFQRLGCVFCPMTKISVKYKEKRLYPGIYRQFQNAFIKLFEKKKSENRSSITKWVSGEDMFNWWFLEKQYVSPDQTVLFE